MRPEGVLGCRTVGSNDPTLRKSSTTVISLPEYYKIQAVFILTDG